MVSPGLKELFLSFKQKWSMCCKSDKGSRGGIITIISNWAMNFRPLLLKQTSKLFGSTSPKQQASGLYFLYYPNRQQGISNLSQTPAGRDQHFLTMLWWEKEFPEAGWDRALCLELLNTSGCAREGVWDDSRFVDSFSIEEGVFPSRTARSILGRQKPTEVTRSSLFH